MELYCTFTIKAWLKLNMHFDCRYLELCYACIFRLVYIVIFTLANVFPSMNSY